MPIYYYTLLNPMKLEEIPLLERYRIAHKLTNEMVYDFAQEDISVCLAYPNFAALVSSCLLFMHSCSEKQLKDFNACENYYGELHKNIDA